MRNLFIAKLINEHSILMLAYLAISLTVTVVSLITIAELSLGNLPAAELGSEASWRVPLGLAEEALWVAAVIGIFFWRKLGIAFLLAAFLIKSGLSLSASGVTTAYLISTIWVGLFFVLAKNSLGKYS
jgi:hypothetical protein